jgi:beta-lactam-binding protein with PASTA domain
VRCRVPNVIGNTLGRARQRIRANNCTVGNVRRVRSRRSLRGRVVGQRPRGGTVRRRGFPVNLLVARGRGRG